MKTYTYEEAKKEFISSMLEDFTENELGALFDMFPVKDEDGVEYFYFEFPVENDDEDAYANIFTNGDMSPQGYFDYVSSFSGEPVRSLNSHEGTFSKRYLEMWKNNPKLREKAFRLLLDDVFDFVIPREEYPFLEGKQITEEEIMTIISNYTWKWKERLWCD